MDVLSVIGRFGSTRPEASRNSAPMTVSGRPSAPNVVCVDTFAVASVSSFLNSAADSRLPGWKYHSRLVSMLVDACGRRFGLPDVATGSNGFGTTVWAAMIDSDAREMVLPHEARHIRVSVRSNAADIAGSTLLYLPCSSFGSYGRLGPRRL